MSTAHDTMPESSNSHRSTVRPMTERTYLKHEVKRLRKEIAAQRRLFELRAKVERLRTEAEGNSRQIVHDDMRPDWFRF